MAKSAKFKSRSFLSANLLVESWNPLSFGLMLHIPGLNRPKSLFFKSTVCAKPLRPKRWRTICTNPQWRRSRLRLGLEISSFSRKIWKRSKHSGLNQRRLGFYMILPSKKFGVDTQRLGCWGFNQQGITRNPTIWNHQAVESPGPRGAPPGPPVGARSCVMKNGSLSTTRLWSTWRTLGLAAQVPLAKSGGYEAICKIVRGEFRIVFTMDRFSTFNFFFCADSGEKKLMQVCVDVPMRQDRGSRKAAASWGHVGSFRIWWTSKKTNHKTGMLVMLVGAFESFLFFSPKKIMASENHGIRGWWISDPASLDPMILCMVHREYK